MTLPALTPSYHLFDWERLKRPLLLLRPLAPLCALPFMTSYELGVAMTLLTLSGRLLLII